MRIRKSRKRNIIIALAIVIGLLIAVPTLTHGAFQPPVGDNIVRIHLNSYGSPSSVTMNSSGSYSIQDNGKAVSGAFTVAADGSGIKITNGSAVYNLGNDVYIKAGSLSVSNLIQINNGYKFAGDMRIINTGGKLKLINHVDIETYVMGVLPYEMGNSWPMEALKAQAVAARSYAYFIMHSKTRTSVEQDLVNSTSHQVYNGYNASHTNCIAAVNATKNIIMKTPGGQLVFACYSASNGGLTETGAASGATSSNYDYLSFKSDPYDLAFALSTSAYSGKLTIPKTISSEDLKTRATHPHKMLREKLQEANIDINAISGDIIVKSISLANPKASGPDRQFTGADIVLGIPGSADVTLKFGPVAVNGSSAKYPFLNEVLGLNDKFSMLMLREDSSSWLLASVRYGHGAGLSQIGAYQMAAEGKSYQDILTFYFSLGSATKLVTMPWDTSGGTDPGVPGYTVTPVNKTGTVNAPGTTLNVRSGPATGNEIVLSLKDGIKVKITGQVADWWRIDIGGGKSGFVNAAFIKLDSDPQQPPSDPPAADKPANPPAAGQTKTGKVNTPGLTLNVRSGMGTSYSIIGSLKHDEKVTVSTTENSSWYQISYNGKTGYISSAFIVLDATQAAPGDSQSKIVYVNTPSLTLNVRSGPGTSYAIIGSLKHGEKLTVTDENSEWYKLTYNGKAGYVSKAYTKADNPVAPPDNSGTPQSRTVYVNTPGLTLNVRSGPGTNFAIIGSLKHGEKVTVTDENNLWCKLTYNGKNGYINSSFVKNEAVSPPPSQPAQPTQPTQKIGTVTAAAGLNVREGPGTNYKILGGLANGAVIIITDQSGSWYKIIFGAKEAWVLSDFVKV